jgi:PadR family transcriptional regulator PadR
MYIDNVKAQMRKGMLEYCILLVVRNKDMYASDIMNKLKESHLIVVEGTLYPLLTRLKNAGMLAYRWEESTQGPPRKYYTLTSDGHALLADLEASWKELVSTVDNIKQQQ